MTVDMDTRRGALVPLPSENPAWMILSGTMRRLPLAGPLLAFAAVFAAYGCTLDVAGLAPETTSTSGTPSTTTGGGGDAGPASASASASTSTSAGPGGGGGGGTTSTATSVASSSSSGCVPSTEICDNGVDDDCDGLIDCADPGCTTPTDGRACVALAPAGWALTSVAPANVGSCPAGYDTPTTLASPPGSASATCDCTCGATLSNPCTKGQLTIKSGSSCTNETIVSNVTGGCDALGTTLAGPHKSILGNVLKAVTVPCGVTLSKPGQVPSGVDLTCAPQASSAGGCAGGQACLPKVPSGQVCVQATGNIACPGGSPFTVKHLVGSPGDVSDQRNCGACSCASNATTCSNATFTAYTDACANNAVSASLDGGCGSADNNASFQNDTHFIYAATPNVTTCTASSGTTPLSGGFVPNSPITICCQP